MRILELFAGTHSVGKVCNALGYEVVSLDLAGADININILEWDYKKDYKPGDFDVIWSSPPCNTFSHCRRCWIGRKIKYFGDEIVTAKMLDDDMEARGLPIVRKTEEIIKYFNPSLWIIEIGVIKNQLVFGLIRKGLMLKNVIDNAVIWRAINIKQHYLIVVVI